MENQLLIACFLGVVEGLTEFIPVSSTAHLLLVGKSLNFTSQDKIFEIFVQLGAILALPIAFWKKDFLKDTEIHHTIKKVLIAFLPASLVGFFFYNFIKSILFEQPTLIFSMLIAGGIVLIWVDRYFSLHPRYLNIKSFPLPVCLQIGFFQCLAMIPGVSRSGATIMGALIMGANRKSAAEFSFMLSFPTILGATTLTLLKSDPSLIIQNMPILAIGCITSFCVALFVARFFISYVSKHGYYIFGWWRILVGILGLITLYL